MPEDLPALIMNSEGFTVLQSSGKSPSHCLTSLAYGLICISKNTDGVLALVSLTWIWNGITIHASTRCTVSIRRGICS